MSRGSGLAPADTTPVHPHPMGISRTCGHSICIAHHLVIASCFPLLSSQLACLTHFLQRDGNFFNVSLPHDDCH